VAATVQRQRASHIAGGGAHGRDTLGALALLVQRLAGEVHSPPMRFKVTD